MEASKSVTFDPVSDKPFFDGSREALLSIVLPASRSRRPFAPWYGNEKFPQPRPRGRNHWIHLRQWNEFGRDVINYWKSVPQSDKSALVVESRALGIRQDIMRNLEDESAMHVYPAAFHNSAATGFADSPLPSDGHSHWGYLYTGLAGCPRFAMYSRDGQERVTALISLKSSWDLTPQHIDQLINESVDKEHPARLAVEQLYGYMVRNGKGLGILTTMNGWCFLRREDGGVLHLTPMLADFAAVEGVTEGFAAEGYHPTPDYTIMKALYYFSHLAESTADLPESTNGIPGLVTLPFATGSTVDVERVNDLVPHPYHPRETLARPVTPTSIEMWQYHDGVDYTHLLFEPWKKENRLGVKAWKATAMADESPVVVKFWDGWVIKKEEPFPPRERDEEAAIHLHLRPLWGKYVPHFRAISPFDYMHVIIMEYIDARPLSASNLTSKVETEIMKAFDAIHELDVIHGDVREQNILVTDDESVFIIDFDHSYRLSEPIPVYPCEPIPTAEEYVAMEQKQIKVLFQQLKSQKSGMR